MISVTPGGGVKDPADQVTADLPGLVPKRGRGRPRKADALSAAFRAKRYRDKRQARRIAAAVGAYPPETCYICTLCGELATWRPYGVAVWCGTCWPRRTDPNGS